MSETLATSIPQDAVVAAHGDRIPAGFSSTHSLNLICDEELKGIHLHQRSFSAEDTSCNKENHFASAPIQNGLSFKGFQDHDSGNISGNAEFPNDGSGEMNSCEKADLSERTIVEDDRTLAYDIGSIQEEEIRRIEEAVSSLTDGLELPRAHADTHGSSVDGDCKSFCGPVEVGIYKHFQVEPQTVVDE
ncbi:hypothetical protein COOONC_06593 [Cooperia oncophora]